MITGGVALALFLLALWVGWQPLRRLAAARRHQKLISGYGIARLDNVILDDGIGGQTVVDHLLLTPEGLLLLLPRHCDGALFGGDKIDSWTQVTGAGKSFHFQNPLHQLDEVTAAVRYQLPGIPLQGRVLFSGRCSFPKGRPERLLLLDELSGQEGRVDQAVVPVLEQAWQKLQSQPRSEPSGDDPLNPVSGARLWLAVVLLLGAVGWVVWRLELLVMMGAGGV